MSGIQSSMLSTPKYVNKVVHLNIAQAKFLNANCKEMYNTWARGTGKTHILAAYEGNCMHSMPRCTRLLLGPSYRKLVTDLLPGMVVSWEIFGYRRDEHYVIGNSPIPKKMQWLDPIYAPPASYRQFMIHWYTGAAQRIGSADRKVTLNGLSLDGISADEVKLIPEDIFKETIKTNRANPNRPWSHLPEHNSIICFTDKYWTRKGGNWIMKKKALADMQAVNDILILQGELNKLADFDNGKVVFSDEPLANRLKALLIKLRNNTVAFFEAPVYVNIPAITPQFILQMQKNMPELEFRASMLNHDIIRNDEKEYFYPILDENVHGYVADNFEKLDSLEFNFSKLKAADCTFDTDISPSLPLSISVDWGGTINCMTIYQTKGSDENMVNAMYTLNPLTIKDLSQKFIDYYKPHKNRDLYMYYDPSGNNKRADSSDSLAQEFAGYLRAAGWNVIMMSLGQHNNPQYLLRYELMKAIMHRGAMRNRKYPNFYINRNNCKDAFISLLDAGVIRIGDEIKKDKSSEKPKSGVLPQHATHFSDTVDTYFMAKHSKLIDRSGLPSTAGEM